MMDDKSLELPREAFIGEPFLNEISDTWIRDAEPTLQIAAMKRWFLARYQDPQIETPWDSETQQYFYVWGGPYDPSEVIQDRFSGDVPEEVMDELIKNLISEVGDEWASVDDGMGYDEYLAPDVKLRSDPYANFNERFNEINVLLRTGLPVTSQSLVLQMLHGAIISSLEAYLADTATYWILTKEPVLKNFLSSNPDFQKRNFPLSDIFVHMGNLINVVDDYLANLIWHRLDKIKPMMKEGLNIEIPSIEDLMRDIIVRHDIVHRAGKTKGGLAIKLEETDVIETLERVQQFVDQIEAELHKRFPVVENGEF